MRRTWELTTMGGGTTTAALLSPSKTGGFTPLASPAVIPPPSPSANVSAFTEMPFKSDKLPKMLSNVLGYTRPSPVQAAAMPWALQGHDIICQSQSGSGKTVAFAVPALEAVDPTSPTVQVLVIVPTRDLAEQHVELLNLITKAGFPSLRTLKLTGGGSSKDINTIMASDATRPHVVVATMGSLLNFLEPPDRNGEHPVPILHLSNLKMLVVDEVDGMMSPSFEMEMRQLWRHVIPRTQVLCFSATYGHDTMRMCRQITNQGRVKEVLISEYSIPVKEYYTTSEGYENKLTTLMDLAESHSSTGRTIVFFNLASTRDRVSKFISEQVQWLQNVTKTQPHHHATLHFFQSFTQDVRAFRSNEGLRVLLATDGVARGIDLPDVSLVINFDTTKYDTYRQRIRRCGRGGKEGVSVVLVSSRQISSGEGSINELRLGGVRDIIELPRGGLSLLKQHPSQNGAVSGAGGPLASIQLPLSTTTTITTTSSQALPPPSPGLQIDREMVFLDLVQEVKDASEDIRKLLRSLERSQPSPELEEGLEGVDYKSGLMSPPNSSYGGSSRPNISLPSSLADQVEEIIREMGGARRMQETLGREYETTMRGRTIERRRLEGDSEGPPNSPFYDSMTPSFPSSPATPNTLTPPELFGPKEYLPSELDGRRKTLFKALVRDVNNRGIWVRVGDDDGVFPFKDAKLSVRQGGDFDFRPGHVLLVQLLKIEGLDSEPKLSKLDVLYIRHLEM